MTFLDAKYELPKKDGSYMKFQEGQNKFRVVSSAIVGYEYWNKENKPVRLKHSPKDIPADIRDDSAIKHFWAFAVINRWNNKLEILEVTQSSIMKAIKALVDNADWGDPKEYDITVTRTGQKLDTVYTVQPSPHKPLTEEDKKLVAERPVNLEALFTGENPFEEKPVEFDSPDVQIGDIKF